MSILKSVIGDLLRGVRQASVGYATPQPGNPLIQYLENNAGGRVTQKWRHYFDIYHRHFAAFRDQPLTMIEIGVFNGGSLRMWRGDFWLAANISLGGNHTGRSKLFSPGRGRFISRPAR